MTIYLSPPDVGPVEREMLLAAFDSNWIAPVGPDLTAFEQEFAAITGWPGAVAPSSASAALHLALLAAGAQRGDDVLCSMCALAASSNAIGDCGAELVFIDSESESWKVLPALLADELVEARRHNELATAAALP